MPTNNRDAGSIWDMIQAIAFYVIEDKQPSSSFSG
jgi:hypothetical protein